MEIQLMGFAIVRLEEAMKARIWSRTSSSDVQWPCVTSVRTKILSSISICFIHDACVGVEEKTI